MLNEQQDLDFVPQACSDVPLTLTNRQTDRYYTPPVSKSLTSDSDGTPMGLEPGKRTIYNTVMSKPTT